MKNGFQPLNIIKSKKILKCIFNHLRNKQKLIMMNYNKVLQNKFGYTIDDYKNNSKRIKVGGLNGYGKEYLSGSNKLIFEGKYLHGKRNGKGIEYFENGKKRFEGEYLKGKRNGKGIEYFENEKRFEGEYLNEKRNSKGIEYFENGKKRFEGEYLNGKIFNGIEYNEKKNEIVRFYKWNGKGYTYYGIKLYEIKNGNGYIREYNLDGSLLFKGNYLNGERNGGGKEYSQGKLIFEGNYLNGLRNGKGKEYYDNLRIEFEGEYLNGERWNGILYDYNGDKNCEIKEGKEETTNTIDIIDISLISDFEIFNGFTFHFDAFDEEKERENESRLYFIRSNGSSSIPRLSFLNLDIIELNDYYYNEILKFEGEYINGELNGKGKQYFFDELIFEGEYMDGVRNGLGKDYYINGKIKFEGEYQDGEKNGKGKEYDYFGRLIFEGEYVNNKRMNGIIYKYNNNDFSKYIYLIPANFFKESNNEVPSYKIKQYYYKYHIEHSALKLLNSKLRIKKYQNKKVKVDKRKKNWKINKKCKYLINSWQRKSSFKCIISIKK